MVWWIWALGGILLLVVEAAATRDFTLFCLGSSAILVSLMTLLGVSNFWIQCACFVILSTAMLVWLRDWMRVRLAADHSSRDFSNVLGELVIPLDHLPAFGFGKAELRGSTWTVHNAGRVPIPAGRRCRVMQLKGLTLWIMPE